MRDGCSAEFSLGKKATDDKGFGTYTPGRGFKVADTARGDLNIRLFAYARYLNQRGLDPTYTDSFGKTSTVKQRQDIQFNKAVLFFQGWLMSPKFRYSAYVWTANTSQGQPAQVVVAGFFAYTFNPHATLGIGIQRPARRPQHRGPVAIVAGEDQRLIADEFFRPSYTSSVFARGEDHQETSL